MASSRSPSSFAAQAAWSTAAGPDGTVTDGDILGIDAASNLPPLPASSTAPPPSTSASHTPLPQHHHHQSAASPTPFISSSGAPRPINTSLTTGATTNSNSNPLLKNSGGSTSTSSILGRGSGNHASTPAPHQSQHQQQQLPQHPNYAYMTTRSSQSTDSRPPSSSSSSSSYRPSHPFAPTGASSIISPSPTSTIPSSTTARELTSPLSTLGSRASAFASFLSPPLPISRSNLGGGEHGANLEPNTTAPRAGTASSSSRTSGIITRPRAGTLPISLFSNDGFAQYSHTHGASSTAPLSSLLRGQQQQQQQQHPVPTPISSNNAAGGVPSQQRSGSIGGSSYAQYQPAPLASSHTSANPAPGRPVRRQTFLSGLNSASPSAAASAGDAGGGGSSSASLVSSATFQPFYSSIVGSLSASASRPGSASGLSAAPVGGHLLANPPSFGASTPTPVSSLSHPALSGSEDSASIEGTQPQQQQQRSGLGALPYFPGRLRGHTTTLAPGSGPGAFGTLVGSTTPSGVGGSSGGAGSSLLKDSTATANPATTPPSSASTGSGPSGGSAFLRQLSPLRLNNNASSATTATSSGPTSSTARPSSPSPVRENPVHGRTVAATAPNSTVHSPALGQLGNTGGGGGVVDQASQRAAPLFGRDGLFGATTTTTSASGASSTAAEPQQQQRQGGSSLGRRVRPSTSSSAAPFSSSSFAADAYKSAFGGVDILYTNNNNSSNHPSSQARSNGTTTTATATGASSNHRHTFHLEDFYMSANKQQQGQSLAEWGGGAEGGEAEAAMHQQQQQQQQPLFLSRVGAELRTASSGSGLPSASSVLSMAQQQPPGGGGVGGGVLGSSMRSRALTLAHPNPHSHPHAAALLGGGGHPGPVPPSSSLLQQQQQYFLAHHEGNGEGGAGEGERGAGGAGEDHGVRSQHGHGFDDEAEAQEALRAITAAAAAAAAGVGYGNNPADGDSASSRAAGTARSSLQANHSNRPRAISTGTPPFFTSRATAAVGTVLSGGADGARGGGSDGFELGGLGTGGGFHMGPSTAELDAANARYQSYLAGSNNAPPASSSTTAAVAMGGSGSSDMTLLPDEILRAYALEHGLNPVAFVSTAAQLGFLPGLRVVQNHNVASSNAGSGGFGGAGAGAGGAAQPYHSALGGSDRRVVGLGGAGAKPTVSFQEPGEALQSQQQGPGSSNPLRPSLLHTQSTPAVPGGQQASPLGPNLAAQAPRDDYSPSSLASNPLFRGAFDGAPSSSTLATASPRARAATASSAGGFALGGDSFAMSVAAHMHATAVAEREREREYQQLGGGAGSSNAGHLGGGAMQPSQSQDASASSASVMRELRQQQIQQQQQQQLQNQLDAVLAMDGADANANELESSFGSSNLAPLANRFRSGTMAAGGPPGFGASLGAAVAGSRLRAEQELLRMAAIIKANTKTRQGGVLSAGGAQGGDSGPGAGTLDASQTGLNRAVDVPTGRSARSGLQRPATADANALQRSHQLQSHLHHELTPANEAVLAAALNATGDPGMSLLPPSSLHPFATRGSRSNSNASAQSGMGLSPTTHNSGSASGSAGHYPSQLRPRAATTAALTGAGYFGSPGAGLGPYSAHSGALSGSTTPLNGGGSALASSTALATTLSGDGSSRFVHGSTAGNQQVPTRSLWIGNLDPTVTSQELLRVFAPYGAVESVRLLPEKECGFVNFVEQDDAVRAREDVLVRLGGRLALNDGIVGPSGQPRTGGTGPNGQVRIGYGKVDSAPGVAQPALGSAADMFGDFGGPDGLAAENSAPTRALWIGSIPSTTTQSRLMTVFQPFGPVESVRVLTHKNCGFVNYERVDDAIQARSALHGRDFLGAEHGAIRIGFAKVPMRNTEELLPLDEGLNAAAGMPAYPQATVDALNHLQGANGISGEQQLGSGYVENYHSNLVVNLLQNKANQHAQQASGQNLQQDTSEGIETTGNAHTGSERQDNAQTSSGLGPTSKGSAIAPSNDKGGMPLPDHLRPQYSVTDLQLLMEELSENDPPAQAEEDIQAVAKLRPLATYYTTIPLVSDVCKNKRFDANRLREIRRQMDSPNFSVAEVDNLAQEFMKDIVDLAADYIGNTAVQKFFERASENCKYAMLEELAPHLAMIGIHKNGTWSAQKIIDCCRRPDQVELIATHLRPYVPPLMLDQYGNYVVQCVLPFSSPSSDFVFDAIVDRIWEVAQGRFGARSMRACLENNNHVTRRQVKRIASAIILHAVPLSTNANGALLLTWLLDTSGLPARYRLLAPRFAPHLAQLCTHKLSSLTIWRIVSQKTDMAASRLILDALFGKADAAENDEGSHPEQANRAKEALPLEEILLDQMHGATFVAKVLGSPAVEAARTNGVPEKPRYVEMVRKILVRNRLVGASAYRRVLEEVGMAESLPIAPASAAASSAPRTAPAPTLASHAQNPSTTFGISSSLAAPRLPSLPPMPQGAPTVPDTGRAPSMVPHGMLAAAAAGNQAALHDLASLGMLPHGLMTGLPPPGAMGMNFDAVELNGMMSQMQLNPALYGSNGLPIPPAGMLGHGSASHLGSGHRGPLGPPLGNGNGQGPHSGAGAFESFSMSPEQAVGSGVLSPPPAPRMGWPVQPQGLQLHQQMPVLATPQQQPSSINPMAQFNLWEPPELPHTGSFGRSPTRSSRPAPIGRGLGGSFGATLPRR